MIRGVLLAAGLVLLSMLATAQERYQYVRVDLAPGQDRAAIARLGIAVDHGGGKQGTWVDLFANEAEVARLREHGFGVRVLIKDWAQEYARRRQADRAMAAVAAGAPEHFHLGSMGGFLTLAELREDLDSMRASFPTLVDGPDSIGASVEGRPIWAMKISVRAEMDEEEPRALYTGLIHAREGSGMMVLLYYMWHLLEQYGIDPEVTGLLESRELYFIPALNPDGYAHNESLAPDGGGMWRKNRRPNADGSIGVDLNRNYGHFWGYDDTGSSPQGGSSTFRGDSAFSEPELHAVRQLCIDKNFTAALNYHSFGNLLIYPWGYSDVETGDSLFYRALGQDLTDRNGYTYGTGGETVGYVTNGDSDDWMYGDLVTKPRIISFTAEVGTDDDGFWPVPSRILRQVEENLDANLLLASMAGPYIRVGDPVRMPAALDSLAFLLPLTDAGIVAATGPVRLSLVSEQLKFSVPVQTIGQPSTSVPVHAAPRAGVEPGQSAVVLVRLSYPGGITHDTLRIRVGEPHVVLEETAEQGLARWAIWSNGLGSHWGATDELSANGRFSVTDSPGKYYSDNTVTTLTLIDPVALTGKGAELRFLGRWDIETNYDVARVELSTNGTEWVSLAGRHTATGSGSGRQELSVPGYDGIRHGWVEEVMDLDAYLGEAVRLRFIFESDASVRREGIFIDDIRILTYDAPLTSAPVATSPVAFALEQNFPNPFNPATTISYALPLPSRARLVVFDLIGRELAVLTDRMHEAGSYTVVFDASSLASGVYFYRLTADGYSAMRRFVVLR